MTLTVHTCQVSEEDTTPRVLFLGVCERAVAVPDTQAEHLMKWNIDGLKSAFGCSTFPTTLVGTKFVLAYYVPGVAWPEHDFNIVILDEAGKSCGKVNLKTQARDAPSDAERLAVLPLGGSWQTIICEVPPHAFLLSGPGVYDVILACGDKRLPIGRFFVGFLEPPELTPDRIAAIKSDPHATKFVWLQIKCGSCGDEFKAYAGIEKSVKHEAEGSVWAADLPDTFSCRCDKTIVDLSYARKSLHGLLGNYRPQLDGVTSAPLYERRSLEDLARRFRELISEQTREEIFQVFIANNPLLLQPFSPWRLFPKLDVLNKFVTDFAIVTPSKELVLVEIENPGTRILKRDGGLASDLQHAFDQVRDWLHTCDEHRLAVLACMNLEPKNISRISGVVIAGRDVGHDEEHLRKLKAIDFGRVRFLTFDDLLGSLLSTINSFDRL